jgi:UDP-GlcNAc:undecaprenyl-phosphate GlcNAc-1-phosphate transferase
MLIAYFGILTAAFLVTLNLVPWIVRLALRFDFVDRPGERKVHVLPTPYGGGLAVALGMGITLLAGTAAAIYQLRGGGFAWFPQEFEAYLTGVEAKLPQLLSILTGGFAILVVGMADDRYKLSPWTRLIAEGLIGLVVALQVGRLDLFLPGSLLGDVAGTAATVVWIVVVTNTFNLLDHFDGICSGVCLVSSICLFAIAVLTGQLFIAALLACLIGSTLGFFLFNFPPARIFLGDGGSLFLGYLMSVTTVLFTFYREGGYPLFSYFVPLVILALPVYDTFRVCVIRLREGRSIFSADRNHVAHRLLDMGLSPRRIVVVVLTLTLVAGLGAVLLYHVRGEAGAAGVAIQVLLVLVAVSFVENRRARTGP